MTDNCPKVFAMSALTYESGDIKRSNPKCIFRFGFGFTGSTLIGTNVKEMLSFYVGNLSEIHYYDQPDYPYEKKLPSLMDIAQLCKELAQKYIKSVGFCFPKNVRCEFLIFGLCPKTKNYRAITLRNSPENPAEIRIEEASIEDNEYLILGDQKERVLEQIVEAKIQMEAKGENIKTAPLVALSSIIDEDYGSIGGYVQLCISNQLDTQLYCLSSDENHKHKNQIAGFSLFDKSVLLGGFMVSVSAGIYIPGLGEQKT
jgi:hypothetical protein